MNWGREKNGTLQMLVGKLLHVYLQSMSENEKEKQIYG